MRLYEIANEYLSAFNSLSEIDGLDNETIENTLAPIKQDINKKSINIFKSDEISANLKNKVDELETLCYTIKIMIEDKLKKLIWANFHRPENKNEKTNKYEYLSICSFGH
jgi:hypothetical protein